MTKKEAIEQLKQIPIHDGISDNYRKTIYDAIDIAIAAITKEINQEEMNKAIAKALFDNAYGKEVHNTNDEFEPYSTVSPIKGNESKDFFEKYRGYVDVKEGVLYRYIDEPKVAKMDLISREAVLETIEDCNSDGLKGIFCSYDDGKRFEEYIKALPSVKQKEKTGHWVNAKVGKLFPSNVFKCSKCGNLLDFDGVNCGRGDANYCPNCGAKMEVDNGN